jgi:hypothetical protein
MPDIFGELARDWDSIEHAVTSHLHHASAPPAATTATIEPATQEEPVSLADDLRGFASHLDVIGEEAVTKAEAVLANPATAEGFDILHALTGLNVPAAAVSSALGGLKGILAMAAPAQPAPAAEAPAEQPQAVAAGPQVGGQA